MRDPPATEETLLLEDRKEISKVSDQEEEEIPFVVATEEGKPIWSQKRRRPCVDGALPLM